MRIISYVFMLIMFMCSSCWSATVATGKPDGLYHTKVFNLFEQAVTRISGKKLAVTKFNENGTDGSKANLLAVNSGEADIGFVQLDALVTMPHENVEVMGIFMYEVAHLVAPVKGPVDSCDDLESKKKYSVGMNFLSGTKLTHEAMIKVDKDFALADAKDFDQGGKAINAMMQGNLQSYFFVSGPGSENIKRILASPELEFKDCWDRDFKDYKIGQRQLYQKVEMGKAQGYSTNFDAFLVPAVVIANKKFLSQNDAWYDMLFQSTTMLFQGMKELVKGDTYYPSK